MNSANNFDIDYSVPSEAGGMARDVTPPRQRSHRPRKQRTMSHKLGEEMIYYGRSAYMLNRCLDDIEAFCKKLKRHLKHTSGKLEECPADSTTETPLHQDEAIDAVRKIKFAFNTVDEVKYQVPEAAYKVFIRLVKYVRWLDDLCRRQVVADYDSNLVSDVIEPLFSESTIMSLDEQLPPSLLDFWQELGPAWNTPAEKWPNSLTIYMPQFSETLDKNQTMKRWRRSYRSDTKSRSRKQKDDTSLLADETPYEDAKYNNSRILDDEQREYFLRVQDEGSKLCYTIAIHASTKPTELHAMQGEVFELIDSDDDSWWTVKTYTGMTGQLPRWKLRTFHLSKDQNFLDQVEVVDDLQPKTPSTPRYARTTTLPNRYSRHRDNTNTSDLKLNGVLGGRSHSLLHRGQLDVFEESGISYSPASHPYHNHHHQHVLLPERCPPYLTLIDKQDTFTRPATLSRLYNYNSLYPIGSGTFRPFDHSPNAPYVEGTLSNVECGHPHPHTCSCEAIPLGTIDTLSGSGIGTLMGGTITRSNIIQPHYPVMARIHGHQSRSYSTDSVGKFNRLGSSLQRFNSHSSVYYMPTMTLERKRHQHRKK